MRALIYNTERLLEELTPAMKKQYAKESSLQSYVITKLRNIYGRDIWLTKVSDRYIAGIPDIIGCIKGRFFAIELKAEAGKASLKQTLEIESIARAKGATGIARSLEDCLIIILKALKGRQ